MGEQPLLSIVITSYTMERLKDIFELLDSIKAQTYPNIETVFVAERSRELFDRAKTYGEEEGIPGFKVIFNDGESGLSAARNLGIKQAKGDIIAFIDDDAIAYSDWAEEMVKTYRDTSVIGVTGPSFPLWQDQRMAWIPEEFYWMIGGSGFSEWTKIGEVRNVSGTNMSFRREAFEASGPFLIQLGAQEGGGGLGKQRFAGEETELSIRVRRKTGKRILYSPKVRVQHKVYKYRVNPMFVAKRAYSEGFTKAMLNKNYLHTCDNERLLNVEYKLLWLILTQLLFKIGKRFFTSPVTAWHQLSLTLNAVFFVAVGYFSYSLQNLFRPAKTMFVEGRDN